MGSITRIQPMLPGGTGDYKETYAFSGITAVGQAVCVDPSNPAQLTLADVNDATKLPCVGLVTVLLSATSGNIEARPGKTLTVDTYNFTAGSGVYLSTSGTLTDNPSASVNGGSQQVGVAMSATKVCIQLGTPIFF